LFNLSIVLQIPLPNHSNNLGIWAVDSRLLIRLTAFLVKPWLFQAVTQTETTSTVTKYYILNFFYIFCKNL